MSTRTVLSQADITRALTRISHEVLESNRGPAFEGKQDPASCPIGHDHTICIQVGANAAVTGPRVRLPQSRVFRQQTDLGLAPSLRSTTRVLVHGPRGPPIA